MINKLKFEYHRAGNEEKIKCENITDVRSNSQCEGLTKEPIDRIKAQKDSLVAGEETSGKEGGTEVRDADTALSSRAQNFIVVKFEMLTLSNK